MEQLFKQSSIQQLVKYNKHLLLVTVLLAITSLLATIKLISKEEKWVLIPAIEPDRRMIVSSQNYHETYLQEWAIFVMKGLFTTSPEEVERQIADMKVVSSSTEQLDKFFQEYLQFVKGSNVSSVFFPKKVKITDDGVLIQGTFRYWFGENKHIATDKSYLLTYKRGTNYLLLLTGIKEETNQREI
ncbi:TraE/TraK family type IV conjugative transfer system protein [Candidatus Tisiphia endosymbiont of Parasteatoda lunata]|uniref:TraE/TraK family type IV conjugative transfer system protein n=1 Tax=Candidatus Tisiphia endosymbiont of Parasteatoda lunata TaxID=3066275 RepID=UPI00313BC7FD